MRPGQLTALMLQPSFFSGTLSLIITLLVLGAANLPAFIEQPVIHDYLLGPEGLVTLIRTENGSTIFGESFTNNLITVVAAATIGLVVLFVLEAIRHARTDAPISGHEGRVRLGVRLLVGLCWLAFVVLTVKIILPFCILASQVGITALWQVSGFGYLLFGSALSWLCLHVHAIFMRLFLLRVRVFGGSEAIVEAEARS